MTRDRSTWSSWISRLGGSSTRSSRVAQKSLRRRFLKLEPLERRELLAVVTVLQTDSQSAEQGNDSGVLTISLSDARPYGYYSVEFTLSGSLDDTVVSAPSSNYLTYISTTNGNIKYSVKSYSQSQRSIPITVTPLDDARPEGDHTVSLTLDSIISMCCCCCGGGETNSIGSPSSGTITITDNDQWEVSLTGEANAQVVERHTDDATVFTISRVPATGVANPAASDTKYAIAVDLVLAGSAEPGEYTVKDASGAGLVIQSRTLEDDSVQRYCSVVIPANSTSTSVSVTPVNDAKKESDEAVAVSLANAHSTTACCGGCGCSCCYSNGYPAGTYPTTGSGTVTILDDDHWVVEVQANDATASERLGGVVPDPGWFTFTRVDDGSNRSGDTTYYVQVTMEVTEVIPSTSPAYAHWIPSGTGDYDFVTSNEPGENEVFLSGFTYVNSNATQSVDVWTVVDTFQGSIPLQETSAKLKVQPRFDWEDEGEQFDPGTGTPDAQAGEIVDLTVVSVTWPGLDQPGSSQVGANTHAEVEIKDGGIIIARTDSDNDGDLDADDDEEEKDPNSLGRVFMVNTDDDNDNDVADNWERPDNFNMPANSSAWDAGTDHSVTVANENDLAETRFYAWVDSLAPKDPANPVVVDIYASGSIDLILWTQATKGRRLHYGKDVSPADGRMDEETRLITLDQSTTSFDKTIYVEANTYSSGKRPVSLCADVVNGGPDGSDSTYYTTLQIDTLAMAFNHDPNDNTGADGVNLRSNGTAGTEHSAPEWIFGSLPFPSPLPNDGAVNQQTALYLADKTVTTFNRITVDAKYEGMFITMEARVTGGAIGGLDEVIFVVSADGILLPAYNAVATRAVNGVDDFVAFGVQNTTSSVVRREEARFYWEVTNIGADVSNGNNTGSNEAVITDPIRMYTVLDTPRSPWDVSDSFSTDDKHQPWVKALEFVTNTAGVNVKDDVGAMATLTTYLHGGHGLTYDTVSGAPEYASGGLGGTMLLSEYIDKSRGNVINCYDQAAAVTSLGRLLGLDVQYKFMEPFGYINTVDLVGVGNCNNPFFTMNRFPQIAAADETGRSLFGNHAFAMYGGHVYDACALEAGTKTLAAYLAAVIDTSTWTEWWESGDASDVVNGSVVLPP